MLRTTVSGPVCLVDKPHLGPKTIFLLLSERKLLLPSIKRKNPREFLRSSCTAIRVISDRVGSPLGPGLLSASNSKCENANIPAHTAVETVSHTSIGACHHYLCVSHGSPSKQWLFPSTTLTIWSL
jgi:hypothetical protein